MRAFFIYASLLIASGCSHAPIAGASAPDSTLQPLVGQTVTLHGQFDLAGKVGPYIHRSGEPVYLVPGGSFSWGADYERMQGKMVSVTGILRFRHFEHGRTSDMTAHPSDYFYFDAERAKIKLD